MVGAERTSVLQGGKITKRFDMATNLDAGTVRVLLAPDGQWLAASEPGAAFRVWRLEPVEARVHRSELREKDANRRKRRYHGAEDQERFPAGGDLVMGNQETKTLQTAEADFKRRLLELGLLTRITPPSTLSAMPRDREPVPVAGNCVSETIIKERR